MHTMKYRIVALILVLFNFGMNITSVAGFSFSRQDRALTIYVPDSCAQVVREAVKMFCDDYHMVFGSRPTRVTDRDADIIIGTTNDGRWEAFELATGDNNRLYVLGSDARGTAYGVLELSRLIGVSPWVWWADVPPQALTDYSLPDGYHYRQQPSVQYRGIFLNDEDYALNPWSWKTHEPSSHKGEIGPHTYERIFQLLLRLRANMLMPAMHDCTVPFYMVAGNKEMAHRYGIVISTSHCEPLMRNNVGEWDDARRGKYNYRTNRDSVLGYWSERLQEVADCENIYTIGMRGKHDGKMEGYKNIDEMAQAMPAVIDDQRALLAHYVDSPVSKVPQLFVPYKELLDVYNKGLQLPDDVTLMWCDDNYGHITRLSNERERMRRGGAGIYYHISYWGRPHSYLWLCTTPPAQIYYEMRRAWDFGARKVWALNVGDIKPAEYEIEFFMDMAWNIDKINASSIYDHLTDFMCRAFTHETGREIADIMNEYYYLANIRKPEFMGWSREEEYAKIKGGKTPVIDTEFSPVEIENRIWAYRTLESRVDSVKKKLSKIYHDAFFQLVEYPVCGAANMNYKWLYAQKARNASSWHDARYYEHLSIEAYNAIAALDRHYNHDMARGKWNGMISMKNNRLVFEKFELPDDFTPISSPEIRPEKGRYISWNAASFRGKAPHGVYTVEGLGYSREAVVLPVGATITYRVETPHIGNVSLWVSLLPTHAVNGGDLRYEVTVDNETPVVVSYKTRGRSEQWKINVLRNLSLNETVHHIAKPGKHTIRIKALDDGVVVDQLMLDFEPHIPFYRIPDRNLSKND